ncbi:TPA: hypothetical protein ACIVMK_004060, partial [Salmonella enterica subsp. enterica serovar Birkenhead]
YWNMKSLSENGIINVSGAGFGDYGGYTSGELGAKAGCAIDSILGVPACGHNNGKDPSKLDPKAHNISEPLIPKPNWNQPMTEWHGPSF